MEKQPSFDKIIAGTEEQRKNVEEKAREASLRSGEEIFGDHLVEPTKEEKESIQKAVLYANAIARSYGGTRQFDVDRIFVLKSGGVEAITKGNIKRGVCDPFEQSIAVDRSDSGALLALVVAHEIFHMDGYQAAQVVKIDSESASSEVEDRQYRSGISMQGRSDEGEYFGIAEEAIIATLSKRFLDESIANDPLYKMQLDRTIKIKDWLINTATVRIAQEEKREEFVKVVQDIVILPNSERVYKMLYESDKEDNYKLGYFAGYFNDNLKSGNIFHERSEEREKFDTVLDKIVAQSGGKIKDKSELFDQFARAHFTGNYFTLARTIEDALGKGAFRKIATELGNMKSDDY